MSKKTEEPAVKSKIGSQKSSIINRKRPKLPKPDADGFIRATYVPGYTVCPYCANKGRKWDVKKQRRDWCVVYHTRGIVHYMKCRHPKCGKNFKAVDPSEAAQEAERIEQENLAERVADRDTALIRLRTAQKSARAGIGVYRVARDRLKAAEVALAALTETATGPRMDANERE